MEKKKCDSSQERQSCGQSGSCSEDEKKAHQDKMVRETLAKIQYKIMVMSGKGGVGKSTVATNLAVSLARMGRGGGNPGRRRPRPQYSQDAGPK